MSTPLVTKTTLASFLDCLENHDWLYEYSDDGRVWKRGARNQKELEAIARTDPLYQEAFNIVQKSKFHHDLLVAVTVKDREIKHLFSKLNTALEVA